jgi:hypothetical protein
MYVLLSSDSDLHFLGKLIAKAGFRARIATVFSIMIESMIIYELTPLEADSAADLTIGTDADNFEDRNADNFVGRQNARVDRNHVRA